MQYQTRKVADRGGRSQLAHVRYTHPAKRSLLGLLGVLVSAGASLGQNAFSLQVGEDTTSYATFQEAIYAANGATSQATLNIDYDLTGGTVSLGSQLMIGLYMLNTGGLTIKGNNVTIDMNGQDRAFFIASGSVTLQNMTIANGFAQGGSGGNGGGGGAGLGGAIFVANPTAITSSGGGFTNDNLALPTAVTLTGVTFSQNKATGGSSLSITSDGPFNSGGGGGMGGDAGSGIKNDFSVIGGGGGGFGNGATGGTYNGGSGPWHGDDGAMVFTQTPPSATPSGGSGADESSNAGQAAGGGGMGENDDFEDQAGGGGGANGVGGNSSYGGGGGFGGGGGGGTSNSGSGGAGGFGGGGGANVEMDNDGTVTPGNGGFGGGGGVGAGGDSDIVLGSGGFAAGDAINLESEAVGGTGASLGGAIFVMNGASLNIISGTFSSNQALAPANAGTVSYGDDIFLGGDVTFSVAANETVSLTNLGGAGNLSDANVANNQNDSNAQGGIIVQGGGTVQLNGAHNYYSGGTMIYDGTLSLAAGAVETGTASVTVGQIYGGKATLALGSSSGLFLKGFNTSDPQNSTDVAVQIADGENSEGKIVIGSGAGSGGAEIGARTFHGGEGDAAVEFQQNYAAGSTTDTTYEFYTTLTGRIIVYQSGPGTTVLKPMYGENTFEGAVFITGGTLATAGEAAALAGAASITMQDANFAIGQSDGINNTAVLYQYGGTLSVDVDNLEQTFGAWVVSDLSILDFNEFAAHLSFSSLDISGMLSIYNYDASADFITLYSGTVYGDLSQISFYSDEGQTFLGTAKMNGFSLEVVPEPATWLLVGVGAALLYARRRRV